MIEANLRGYILADASIDALIGERFYAEILPQNPTLPAATYTRISTIAPEQQDGSPDLIFAIMQISCWGATPGAAAELAALIRVRMQGVGGDEFQKAGIQDERSSYEEETELFRQDLDVQIGYAASDPA